MDINIMDFINVKYILVQVLGVYAILSFVIKNPSENKKHILSFLWGITLGLIWYYPLKAPLDVILVSLLIAIVGYDKIINPILTKLGYSHDDFKDKGIIGKSSTSEDTEIKK